MKKLLLIFLLLPFFACEAGREIPDPDPVPPTVDPDLYFPPLNTDEWESISPAELGWKEEEIPALLQLLENNDSRAFLLLKDGKIAIEAYFGRNLINTADFTQHTLWYWASAGKTLTAFTVGMAQEEGFLDIQDKSSDYLGEGWTSLTPEQEAEIKVWNQLTMTCGLDDGVANSNSFEAEDLIFKSNPGDRWAYHNAPYTLLDQVVESAVGEDFDTYFNKVLKDKIGMDGNWLWTNGNHVYFSSARSMARFGLLIQNRGSWEETSIMTDDVYFQEMITTSQEINPSYGYLWWLNGKESFMLPQSQQVFNGNLHPAAPADMISAIGKNSQYLSIIPSKGLVMVRLGGNPEEALVPLLFQEEIWEQLNKIIN